MGAGTGSQQSLPQEARTEAKVRAWEAVESSGWGDERCFCWTSSGGHGLGNELSVRLVHPEPVASSTLTALPQGLGILQLRRISVVNLVFTGHSGIAE